ncbi:hypothetical protein KIN20_037479 [Parelaphostrongylus tenuis]|uniref:Uncharacterized protein n=1 Tax=Parelaphostrongylus tenuis TaxID=148309 RepID=A0AAD5RES1_PARTN|nr:hypothetical protein KIN20_037479 [Parelaphostrongylus tenuis]
MSVTIRETASENRRFYFHKVSHKNEQDKLEYVAYHGTDYMNIHRQVKVIQGRNSTPQIGNASTVIRAMEIKGSDGIAFSIIYLKPPEGNYL